MKITKVKFNNFRGISELNIDFHPQLTVISGINGAGKSSIVDGIAIMLSWIAARIGSPKSRGRELNKESDIKNGEFFGSVTLSFSPNNHEPISFTQMVSRKGTDPHTQYLPGFEWGPQSDYKQLARYTSVIQEKITNTHSQCSIPVFVYYPVNRAVLDIPLRIRERHEDDLLSVYDDAFTSGANFRRFFEWFRNREDIENEHFRDQHTTSLHVNDDHSELKDYPDRQLKAVRDALSRMMPDYSGLRVNRNPLRMVVNKQNTELQINQLSDGEKCLIAMIGDLARRLAIANPTMSNPLDGEGVVLIDEIDLHLHPAWERSVPSLFTKTFPNCQFIITTHSPQVLGEVDPHSIRMLDQGHDGGVVCIIPDQSFGLSADQVIDRLMLPSTENRRLSRNETVEAELNEISELIDRDQFGEARSKIAELKAKLHGSIPDIVKAETMISLLEHDDDTHSEGK